MRAVAVLVVVGCGGGPSIPPVEPKVEIENSSCSVQGGGFLTAQISWRVTIEIGQAFVATIDTGNRATNPTTSFFCSSWNQTFKNGEDIGCERPDFSATDTVLIDHTLDAQLDDMPISFSIALLGSAVLEPFSDFMIANAQQTVPCAISSP